MNRFNIVAPLVLASVQLQRGGGLCSALGLQSDDHVFDWGDDDHVFDWDDDDHVFDWGDDEPSGRQEDSENSNLINCVRNDTTRLQVSRTVPWAHSWMM